MICAALFSIGDVHVVVTWVWCGTQLQDGIDGGGVTAFHALGETIGASQWGHDPTTVYIFLTSY